MTERLNDRKLLQMTRRVVKEEGGKLWGTRSDLRQDAVDLVERVVLNCGDVEIQLKAVQLMIAMEAQNLAVDRMNVEDGGGKAEAQVILLLPENGTEVEAQEESPAGVAEAVVVGSDGDGES